MKTQTEYDLYYSGTIIKVSKEIYDYLKKNDSKMEYALKGRKIERVRKNNKTGKKEYLPSLEDSYERLQECNVQFQDSSINLIDDVIEKITVAQLIKDLSENERKIITMLYFDELTERKAADVLKISPSALHKKKKQILEKLKKLLIE